MGFVLSPEDFRAFGAQRDDARARRKRINADNRARLDEQQRSTAPVVPTGQQRGLTVNQVGPTAAQQQAEFQKQQESEAMGRAEAQEADEYAEYLKTPAPAGLKTPFVTNVGISGGVDIPQVDQNDPYPVQSYKRAGAYLSAKQQLRDLREQIIPTPMRVAGSNLNPWNLFSTGVNEVRRGLQYYLTAGKGKRESMDLQEKMHDWYGGDLGMGITGNYGEGTKLLYANPKLFAEAKIDPVAFYKKHSQPTAGAATTAPATAPTVPGVATATAPAAPAGLDAAVIHVESKNNPNAVSPKGAVGRYQVMPDTLKDPQFGVAPARDDSDAERDRVGRDYLAAMVARYPGNLNRALAAYNWGPGNTDKWIAAGADPSKMPKETFNYIVDVRAKLQASGSTTVAGITPLDKDIQNNRANPLPPINRPVVEKGGSMADQLAKKKPDKIKEPPFNMPFNLRAQEINTLLAAREGLKRQAYITGADPASAAYIEARAALGMNKVAIENMTETQALNMIQINNDPRMMNEILNARFPGRNIRISPNSDGTFRFEADGKVHGTRISRKTLVSKMRRSNSTLLHAALKAAKAKAIAARDKAIWKFKQAMTEKQYDHFTKLLVEDKKNKGKYKLDEEGRLWSHDDKGRRVLLSEAPRPSPDREGTTVVPTETPVEETNWEGLVTGINTSGVNTSGVTPALAKHWTSSFGG